MKQENTNEKMVKWCRDYEKITGLCSEPDCDTLEGDAYSIFQNLLSEKKRKKTQEEIKEIEKNIELPQEIKNKLNYFLETIHNGIRGESEKGWSYRNLKKDQMELQEYVSGIIKWFKIKEQTIQQEKFEKIIEQKEKVLKEKWKKTLKKIMSE